MVMNTLSDTLAKTKVKILRDRKTKRIENLCVVVRENLAKC